MTKIGLIGQISVGKTTLVNTLLENYYEKNIKKTIFEWNCFLS